jgi:hypothetical protein
MAGSVSTVGRMIESEASRGGQRESNPYIFMVKILFRIAHSCLSRLTEGPTSARTMCPDILYLISSESMNKEYRPICHVYSLGHELPTGGLGNGPEMKYSRSAHKCK